ncbi:DUF1707 SHOCT-like domain-containing protein [Actinophytocola sediminis]
MTEALPPDRIRITDEDRRVVAERLRKANEDGSLDLTEFDLRSARLWQEAATRGDLIEIVADLPLPDRAQPPPAPVAPPRPPPTLRGGASAMRVLTAIWLSASAVNFVVWLLITTMVTTASVIHPWWLWVLLPPGSVLAVLWAMGFGRRR